MAGSAVWLVKEGPNRRLPLVACVRAADVPRDWPVRAWPSYDVLEVVMHD